MLGSRRIGASLRCHFSNPFSRIRVVGRRCITSLSTDDSTISSKPIPNMTVVNDISSLDVLQEAVNNAIVEKGQVGCSFEGIHHGRYGQLQLVALSVRDPEYRYFLVDVGNTVMSENSDSENDDKYKVQRFEVLKKLFESTMVEKIIHDCRLPSDALYHNHSIQLTNVHDTTRYYMLCAGQTINAEELTYKTLLGNCHLAQEPFPRDNEVLKMNPQFWATRPIDRTMMEWAYSRVYPLLLVAIQQRSRLTIGDLARAKQKSESFCHKLRSMKLATGIRPAKPSGKFAGRKRKTIKHMHFKTTTYLYEVEDFWNVYYDDVDSLNQVKRAMGLYTPLKENVSSQKP